LQNRVRIGSKIHDMKKIVVLMMAIFLGFSVNGFSQDKPHKNVQSGKIEQTKKSDTKKGRTPRKKVTKKKVHKPAPKNQGPKKTGRTIKT
jgi:hypothetical protein